MKFVCEHNRFGLDGICIYCQEQVVDMHPLLVKPLEMIANLKQDNLFIDGVIANYQNQRKQNNEKIADLIKKVNNDLQRDESQNRANRNRDRIS